MYKVKVTTEGMWTIAEVTATMHHSPECRTKSFLDPGECKAWISKDFRIYLTAIIRNYVKHSIVLFEYGDRSFYRSIGRTESLQICKEFINGLDSQSLTANAIRLLQIEKHFENILPAPANPSRQSSEATLTEILSECRHLRKQALQACH